MWASNVIRAEQRKGTLLLTMATITCYQVHQKRGVWKSVCVCVCSLFSDDSPECSPSAVRKIRSKIESAHEFGLCCAAR